MAQLEPLAQAMPKLAPVRLHSMRNQNEYSIQVVHEYTYTRYAYISERTVVHQHSNGY